MNPSIITTINKDKRYYLKHKKSVLQKMKQKILCECGLFTSKGNFYNHLRSKRHNDLLKNKHQFVKCDTCNTWIKHMHIHINTKLHKQNEIAQKK